MIWWALAALIVAVLVSRGVVVLSWDRKPDWTDEGGLRW